jgi:hypothetical protein
VSDLAVLLAGIAADAKQSGVTYRQGVVQLWGATTSVRVGTADLVDLPRLSTVTGLSPGDVVALLKCAGGYLIIGKIVRP